MPHPYDPSSFSQFYGLLAQFFVNATISFTRNLSQNSKTAIL
jgi:hypothetical protein